MKESGSVIRNTARENSFFKAESFLRVVSMMIRCPRERSYKKRDPKRPKYL